MGKHEEILKQIDKLRQAGHYKAEIARKLDMTQANLTYILTKHNIDWEFSTCKTPKPKKKKKAKNHSKYYGLYLPDNHIQNLKEYAKWLNITESKAIRECIAFAFENGFMAERKKNEM